MKKWKQKLALVGAAMAAPAAFAEGASTPFDTALDDVTTAATGMIDKVAPKVALVIAALVVIAGIWFAYKQIRKGFGK